MLRKMTIDDIPAVAVLLRRMYDESANYKSLSFSPGRVFEVASQVLKDGFAVVYESDGALVGVMAGAVYQPAFSMELMACDYALYVHPDHRGPVAVRLVAAFISWARSKGAKLIAVGVTAGIDNERAALMYEVMGFKRSGCSLMMEAV